MQGDKSVEMEVIKPENCKAEKSKLIKWQEVIIDLKVN